MDEKAILAVHPGALGDVILFGHLLSALDGRVTLVAGGEKARLLASAGVVEAAQDFDALPMHEVFGDAPPGETRLRKLLGRHGRLVSCFAAGDERAERRLAALCGAAEAAFLPVRPPASCGGHLVELWRDRLGVSGAFQPAAWAVPDEWRTAAGEALTAAGGDKGRPYVALHPGAGSPAKCWPLDRFVELARRLHADGRGVVFVLGPVEREQWDREAVSALCGEFPTTGAPELATLAGLLASAAGYAGNDSGVSHLAAAVGAPTLALFGPTRPEHFRPLGPNVRTLAAAAMDGLGVESVRRALRRLVVP